MSVVTPTILSDGQALDQTIELLSLDIVKEVNKVPYGQLVVLDGSSAKQTFEVSNSDFFALGKEIEVKLRYESKSDEEATVFKGLVVGHGVSASRSGSRLIISLKDAAVRMTRGRKSIIFRDQTDTDVINTLISNNNLEAGTIPTTPVTHPELVQYYCTDWDFVRSRLEANGLLLAVSDGQVSAAEIALNGQPAHQFEYGLSEIYSLEIEADGQNQFPNVEASFWDGQELALSKPAAAQAVSITPGNFDGQQVGQEIGVADVMLKTAVPLDPEEQSAWAQGILSRSRLALLRGRMTLAGLPNIQLLDQIEIAGIGERFNGNTMVTGIRHQVSMNGWQTSIQFGLSPETLAEQRNVVDVPAAGLLPAVNGLQIGVVAAFEEDPNNEFRLRVLLPAIDGMEGNIWARLLSPDAGNERGYVFRPEVGDEVVVGFLNDDPRQAIVLGALYSSANVPPEDLAEPTEDNFFRGIVTKSGIKLLFDDEKAAVTIETPAANKISVDDDAETIEITDQHGNSVTLNSDGITLTSSGDFVIDAGGNVTIKGSQVDVQ